MSISLPRRKKAKTAAPVNSSPVCATRVPKGKGKGAKAKSAPPATVAAPTRAASLSSTIQKTPTRSGFPLGAVARLRGLVRYRDCQKPRGIYSQKAIMNMKPIAVDHTAEEAKECIGIAEQAGASTRGRNKF